MLEIVVCSLIILIDNPQSFTNGDNLGQGNLNLVSEKSGKSQGILLSIICGNPGLDVVFKEIVERHRTNDRLPTITIAHLEPMAQVQVS